jgi:hypothetical protein
MLLNLHKLLKFKVMKNKLSLLLLIAFSLFACKKEAKEVEGCTDPKATNYSSEATKNNSSCTYNAKSIFWFNSDTAINLAGDLLTTLEVYVDNTKVGSIEIDQYVESAPSCGSASGINYNLDLGKNSSKSISYVVKSKDILSVEQTVASGTFTLKGGDCNTIEIKY